MKKTILFIVISILTFTMFIGCESKKAEVVNENPPATSTKLMAPTVVGDVLEVKEERKKILVDSIVDTVKGKIWVTIDDKTNFFENTKEGTSISYHDVSRKFAVGNHVEIYIENGILESNPMEGRATAVYVNETK
ncbi:hypothetical protein [Clostridium sp. Marseille-QA1073]